MLYIPLAVILSHPSLGPGPKQEIYIISIAYVDNADAT